MHQDDDEPQRFLGFPVAKGGWRLSPDDTRPKVMGIPTTSFRMKPLDLRWARSPIRWIRWRREVRRQGAYAPSFDDFR